MILSSHAIAGMLSSFRSSIKLNQFKNISKDVGKTTIKVDESAVGRCCNIIKLWENPFQKNEKTVGLSSQVEAPLNTVDDFLQAEKIAENCFKEFLKKSH